MEEKAYCLPEGTVLKNRYELVSVIGTGGFGVIYRALDRILDCPVAVKEFFPQEWAGRDAGESAGVRFPEGDAWKTVEECLENFRHEARILEAAKDVPYIARSKDYFAENGTEYLVLNLISGCSLSEYAKQKGGKVPAEEALALFRGVFDTLAELHGLGIIHRDISPGNLMRSEDGTLYLIDFGSATSFRGEESLRSRQVFAHRGLEAPEHARPDRQGPWTDVFYLCATLVYLITGEGIAEAKDRQQFDGLPQLLMRSALSSAQQNALLKGLAPEISRRFSSAEALYAALYGENLTVAEASGKREVFYHARTFIGSKEINQDNFMVDKLVWYKGEDCEQAGRMVCGPDEIHVAAVCDGVGGASYGELAAKAAIQAVIHFVEAYPKREGQMDRLLEELLDQINEKILILSRKIGRTATTISLFLWHGERYYTVNIGDSPIFLLRKGRLRRLSMRHTLAEANLMGLKPVKRSDWNTLTRFLGKEGVAGSQMAYFGSGKLQDGDVFLICSDGVFKKIEEDRLKRFLMKKEKKSVSAMFRVIERSGKNDNCTAIVLKF